MTEVATPRTEPLEVPAVELGEGPVWDASSQSLVWVDITGRAVYRAWPNEDRVARYGVPSPVGAVALCASGGYVLALEDGFWIADGDCSNLRLLERPAGLGPSIRMNDGKVDPQGRFWAGSMAYDLRPRAGSLYRVDIDGRVTLVLGGLTISNGLDWSPDGRTMYLIDSGAYAILAFKFRPRTGEISERRTLVQLSPSDGMPDGMTVDAQGYLWVALWNGWSVRRYAPDGSPDRVLALPVAQVTSCAFGGSGLDQLYVTTAAFELSADDRAAQPLAGRVFRASPGVSGRPGSRYLGA
jgi:sugar lactone lactonase YvrE